MSLKYKESKFSVLVKHNKNFLILSAFDGHIILTDLTCQKEFIAYYNYFENIFNSFLDIVNFFLNFKTYEINVQNAIYSINNDVFLWLPLIKNNEKVVCFQQIENQATSFEIEFTLDIFFEFIKSFSSCILSCLILNPHQKLALQSLFTDLFDWNQVQSEYFNEKYVISYFLKIKQDFLLDIDVSDIISLFKNYLSLFLILKKTNSLTLITIQLAENEASQNS